MADLVELRFVSQIWQAHFNSFLLSFSDSNTDI